MLGSETFTSPPLPTSRFPGCDVSTDAGLKSSTLIQLIVVIRGGTIYKCYMRIKDIKNIKTKTCLSFEENLKISQRK